MDSFGGNMFRTTPRLTPDQFRWLKELRTQRVHTRCLPESVRDQLIALNYIEPNMDGPARVTGQGQAAVGMHVGL